jgi:hypothetical protein
MHGASRTGWRRAKSWLGSQMALELLDGLTQRRLRHVQPLRRASEVQFLGHRDEGLDPANLHDASQYRASKTYPPP